MKSLYIWLVALPLLLIASIGLDLMLGPIPNILYHYQTLVTGLLALGSAVIAAVLLREQTRQARALEEERQSGQRAAARSWLSLHLSSILHYAEDTGGKLWKLMGQCKEGKLPHGTDLPEFPALPMTAAMAVKEFAQFATRDEARYIALLFASMQLLDTNVRGLASSKASHYKDNLESFLINAAELYARTEALLDFSRLTSEKFPDGAEWSRLRGGIFFMTLSHEPTEKIAAYIARGSGGDLSSFIPNHFGLSPD